MLVCTNTVFEFNNYGGPEGPCPLPKFNFSDFQFGNFSLPINNTYYLQIQGTAMGTKMAPAYANLFMGKLEIELKQIGEPHILIWKRFIDDIFIIIYGREPKMNSTHTWLN